MGFSRHFLKENNFLLTRVSGDINKTNLMEHMIAFNNETSGISDLRELGDLRGIESLDELSVSQTTRLAGIENSHPGFLLAMVTDENPLVYGMARAFQMFAENNKKEVRVFKDMDEALSWIAKDDEEFDVLKAFIENA